MTHPEWKFCILQPSGVQSFQNITYLGIGPDPVTIHKLLIQQQLMAEERRQDLVQEVHQQSQVRFAATGDLRDGGHEL
jgi:hypothetical protein